MVLLKPGDRVSCKLKEDRIVGPYEEFDDIKIFEIVAVSNGYYLFIPHYVFIHGSKKADRYLIKEFSIQSQFLGEELLHALTENKIFNIKYILSGMTCVICGDFYEYATSNQPDGALICFSCKRNPYR